MHLILLQKIIKIVNICCFIVKLSVLLLIYFPPTPNCEFNIHNEYFNKQITVVNLRLKQYKASKRFKRALHNTLKQIIEYNIIDIICCYSNNNNLDTVNKIKLSIMEKNIQESIKKFIKENQGSQDSHSVAFAEPSSKPDHGVQTCRLRKRDYEGASTGRIRYFVTEVLRNVAHSLAFKNQSCYIT